MSGTTLPEAAENQRICLDPSNALMPCSDGRWNNGVVPSKYQLRDVARQLRNISELTEHLPEDSPPDAALRDRLDLAADILGGAAKA